MKNFQIFVDRLKDGLKQTIHELVPASFIGVDEKELLFNENVLITGETYLVDENLILSLKIQTAALLPCRICNSSVRIPINVVDFYHSEPISEIKNAIFDFSDEVRSAVLLKIPQFAECQEGRCPERDTLKKYLKQPDTQNKKKISNHFPFADLGK